MAEITKFIIGKNEKDETLYTIPLIVKEYCIICCGICLDEVAITEEWYNNFIKEHLPNAKKADLQVLGVNVPLNYVVFKNLIEYHTSIVNENKNKNNIKTNREKEIIAELDIKRDWLIKTANINNNVRIEVVFIGSCINKQRIFICVKKYYTKYFIFFAKMEDIPYKDIGTLSVADTAEICIEKLLEIQRNKRIVYENMVYNLSLREQQIETSIFRIYKLAPQLEWTDIKI